MCEFKTDIKKTIIESIKKICCCDKKLFKSEWEFEYELAVELKNRLKNEYNIFIEYCELDLCSNDYKGTIFVDIAIQNKGNNNIYPIQLKYSAYDNTNKCVGGTNSGGKLIYGFVEDISIVEKFFKIANFKNGYCILLTNDPYVLKPTKNIQQDSPYKDFIVSLETKIIKGKRIYHGEDTGLKAKPILEINEYFVQKNWHTDCLTGSFKEHAFLLLEIPPMQE